MAKKNESNIVIDAFTFSKDSVVVTDTNIYDIELFTGEIDEGEELKDDIAYINGEYFYLYRGQLRKDFRGELKPGIYKNVAGEKPAYVIVDPRTDEEKLEYDVKEHVASLHPTSVIDVANAKEEILIAIPESTKIFQPILAPTDDILKRISKLALIEKEVDLDRHKDRFADKNALFNFKQVIKGENKLSILIFNRGCDALNLKYTITLEEKDDTNYVGKKLERPIVVSSEDTYEI